MSSHREFKIAGVTVMFPCKPYPSQFSMMDKIIRGIERHQNCLLESPTGSGKTLALLCSTLAWQTEEKKKQAEEIQMIAFTAGNGETCCCNCHSRKTSSLCSAEACEAKSKDACSTKAVSVSPPTSVMSNTKTAGHSVQAEFCTIPSINTDDCMVIDDNSDDEFRPLEKFRTPGSVDNCKGKCHKHICIEYEDDLAPPAKSIQPAGADNTCTQAYPVENETSQGCSNCGCTKKDNKITPRRIPKIFFGTRTHKQVAQIVRELRKTAYHDVSMTILASREHTCINPQIVATVNKSEGCKDLLQDVGCRFKDRVLKYQSQAAIKSLGLSTAWDLEDLVSLMKAKKACPYFLSRGLKEQADLIICPYNYLIDPLIRESMEINLRGQIIVLDEAHNIEDSAREAASQTISQEQIQRVLQDMDRLMENGIRIADISKLRQMCFKLDSFINKNGSSLTHHDFNQSYRLWSGFDIVAELQNIDLGPQSFQHLKSTFASIKAEENEEHSNPDGNLRSLSSSTTSLLEQLFLALHYLYTDNMKYTEDYRVSIVKSICYAAVDLDGSWLSSRKSRRGRRTQAVEVFTLNFWCMNPAVGFSDFSSCRTVILTSGTLSPMDSFQSELGLPFPILLEANHVIRDDQVWVGAIGQGPDGTSLQAVYRNMETFGFQDQLGQLILAVCKTVPKGVLCFLPSYNALDKLAGRWKQTGMWEQFQQCKHVLSEPRGSDKMDFQQVLKDFYRTINDSPQSEECAGGSPGGALFFAVCRGKVSEGLDFADNFARAVITVGIPFPNFKDVQVELKRKYNDIHQSSRGLLSGHLWYEIQAFRALNQALGRCIRHRHDWGALIIVDDRFVKNTQKYGNGLSKWVRQKLRVHHRCDAMLACLRQFTTMRLEQERGDSTPQEVPLQSICFPSLHLDHGPDGKQHPAAIVSKLLSSDADNGRKKLQSRGHPNGKPASDSISPTPVQGSILAQPCTSSPVTMVQTQNSVQPAEGSVTDIQISSLAIGQSVDSKLPLGSNLSMVYIPLTDPALPCLAVMMPPGQQLLLLPAEYHSSLGGTGVSVPPNTHSVILAHSLEKANEILCHCLKSESKTKNASSSKPLVTQTGFASSSTLQASSSRRLSFNSSTPQTSVTLSMKAPNIPVTPAGMSPLMASSFETPVHCRLKPSISFVTLQAPLTLGDNGSTTAVGSPPLFDSSPSTLTSPLTSLPMKVTKDSSMILSQASPAPMNQQPTVAGQVKLKLTAARAGQIGATSTSTSADSRQTLMVTVNNCLPAKEACESTVPLQSPAPDIKRGTNFKGSCASSTKGCSDNAAADMENTLPRIAKNLFRLKRKSLAATESEGSVSSCSPPPITGKTSDAGLSAATKPGNCMLRSSQATKRQAAEGREDVENEGVVRRLKTCRRSSTIRALQNNKKLKGSMESLDATAQNSVTCSACGFLLLEGIAPSDYETQESMPSSLKDIDDKCKSKVLFFTGAACRGRLKVATSLLDNTFVRNWSDNQQASVQPLYCPSCLQTTSRNLLGARAVVSHKLGGESVEQTWLFSQKVSLS